jgi:ADP-heptose:LPS heptosyltransferase
MEQHAVSRYVELVNKLCSTSFEVPEVKLPDKPSGIADLPERYLVMVPGARWESKKFPPELFGKIFLEIKKSIPGCGAVIIGAASDKKEAQKIRELVPEALDLTGKTSLAQLIPIMARAEAVLTNDSGPMHIAALTGTRIFALFGPTRPDLTGPWGEKNEIITCSGLPCLECMKRYCPATSECHRIDPVRTGEKIAAYIQQKSSGVQL